MKIGIVGAGALGTVFGALLGATFDVRAYVRDPKIARTIAGRGGLVLEGEAPVRTIVTHDASAFEDVDVAIVAVKTYDTIAALAPLRSALPHDATIVSIQNGIEAEEHVDFALGHRPRLALAPTTEAATLREPGIAKRVSAGETHAGWAPEHDGGSGALAAFVTALNEAGLPAVGEANVEPFVWDKLLVNAAINPVTALAGVPNGAILDDPRLRERSHAIANEVAAVAARAGIALPSADPWRRVEVVARATAANRSSMLQDLERGRRTEVEAILGAVVRRADALGVAVPHCRTAYDEVRDRETA